MSKAENQKRYIEQEGLPASVEAERAILGAVILDGSMAAFNQAASQIKPEDFTLDTHRKIYRAMLECADEGATPDSDMLVIKLGGVKALDKIGGASYLFGLTDGLPRVKNIEHYVSAVREKSKARMLLALFQTGAAKIRDHEPPDEVLAEAQQQMIEVVRYGRTGKAPEIADIGRNSLNELAAMRSNKGECIGLSTGLSELDELTTGFRESEFYVVGARPGQGKTALACQSLRQNCKNGRNCGFFSVEVTGTQIFNRLIAMETKVSVFELRDPRWLDQGQMDQIHRAAGEISKWPVLIEDSPSLDIRELTATARLFVSRGAEIIYVDYLQKLKAPGRDRFEKVTAIANGLWELARATGVPVVALSQLRRKQNPNDEPTMDDLRESGEIEQNANAVFLLHRPIELDAEGKRRFSREDKIIIAKQRSGPAERTVKALFRGDRGMFVPREAQ